MLIDDDGRLRTSHARYARHTAIRLGLSWRALDSGDGYIFKISDGARSAVMAAGAATPYVLNNAAAYSVARDKGFANDAMARAGLPTIPSRLFFVTERHAAFRTAGQEPDDLRSFGASASYPIFCKPVSGARGDFAERLADANGLHDYIDRVRHRHDAILVQPFLTGVEHRVFVLGDQALFSYVKSGPHFVADGVSDITALYQQHLENIGPTAVAHPPGRSAHFVTERGVVLALSDVPEAGVRVRIDGRSNRSAGGDACEFTDRPAVQLASVAISAARAIGLGLAGVDVFDVSPGGALSDLKIIEVNANPAVETLEAVGRIDLIEEIWSANLRAALR